MQIDFSMESNQMTYETSASPKAYYTQTGALQMRASFTVAAFAILSVILVSCATHHIVNKNNPQIVFAGLTTDYSLTDLNNYGCEKNRHVRPAVYSEKWNYDYRERST